MLALFALLISTVPDERPVITIDRDNIEIIESCTIKIAASPIIDADGNGVIHIVRDSVLVDFASEHLHGAQAEKLPNEFTGIGIRITAKNVTIFNVRVSGFKIGIHATNAEGLTIHHCDVSNNVHQRLKSTPQKEDESDWLWPHANDNNEWITNYGAGICVEDSDKVKLHDIRARQTQNGIILDRVNDSKVYDCDCSFLSGWGLAMWRSNRNVISRNAFDFCIRGYSHGVYNRGQDSAGILMFEQCCQNIIAENSATHCGDGFFGFAGKEALGEVNLREDLEWYKGRGCNENVICHNDFSDSAAHGLELTFSFDNSIYRNSFTGNAICGIWGGYSQGLTIVDNNFMANGDKPSGNERGAINIEHGDQNLITGNALTFHSCALRLWRDDDAGPRATRWAEANYPASPLNAIQQNLFHENLNNVELRDAGLVSLHGNATQPMETITTGIMVAVKADADPQTCLDDRLWDTTARMAPLLEIERSGRFETRMTHSSLAGRQSIIMTEWGPWDHEGPQPTTQPANTKDD